FEKKKTQSATLHARSDTHNERKSRPGRPSLRGRLEEEERHPHTSVGAAWSRPGRGGRCPSPPHDPAVLTGAGWLSVRLSCRTSQLTSPPNHPQTFPSLNSPLPYYFLSDWWFLG
ncbi:hypothetical protein RRG08_060525, partial [Elysia crispata]